LLVRAEVELARAEVTAEVKKGLQGSIFFIVALVIVLFSLFFSCVYLLPSLMCEERDTLWQHYDKALNRYTSSVEEMLGTTRMDPAPVVDAASRFANLSAYGATEAVLSGRRGPYTPAPSGPGWTGATASVGDFTHFANLLPVTDLAISRVPITDAAERSAD
jgi:hypothetical protein